MNLVLPAPFRPRLTLVVVSCPDRSDLSTHEDMLRSAFLRQLAPEKIDALLSNPEAMERLAAFVSVMPESAIDSCRPAPLAPAEAAAVSARSDALAALPVTSLSPTLIRKRRELINMLWPEDIGTGDQCLQHA